MLSSSSTSCAVLDDLMVFLSNPEALFLFLSLTRIFPMYNDLFPYVARHKWSAFFFFFDAAICCWLLSPQCCLFGKLWAFPALSILGPVFRSLLASFFHSQVLGILQLFSPLCNNLHPFYYVLSSSTTKCCWEVSPSITSNKHIDPLNFWDLASN